jgi:hypothetical protein
MNLKKLQINELNITCITNKNVLIGFPEVRHDSDEGVFPGVAALVASHPVGDVTQVVVLLHGLCAGAAAPEVIAGSHVFTKTVMFRSHLIRIKICQLLYD